MRAKHQIVVIDDDPLYLEHANQLLQKWATCIKFQGPNQLEAGIEKLDLNEITLFLVDFDFGNGTAAKSGIGKFIKEVIQYGGPVCLWSLNKEYLTRHKELSKDFDFVWGKNELNWKLIKSVIDSFPYTYRFNKNP